MFTVRIYTGVDNDVITGTKELPPSPSGVTSFVPTLWNVYCDAELFKMFFIEN